MPRSSRLRPGRAARDLEKYTSVGRLSERQLVRLIEWGRPDLATRKASLGELLGKPLPESWSELGPQRSSEAVMALGEFLRRYEGSPDDGGRFRASIDLLHALCDAHPEALRAAVWPAVRSLERARRRRDDPAAQALEGALLHLSRRAPAVVVSGILNAGNPRFRGAGKKGGRRWRKTGIVRAIGGASRILREAFIVPASHRLMEEDDPSTVTILSQIDNALGSVVRSAREPPEESSP